MEKNTDSHQIKKNTIVSTLSLFFQSGYSAVLGLVANLVLTILVSPGTFGIYITVLSLISFLNYFSDIGLAASLIQKKTITDDDIKTTFTTQQILIISLILIGFLLTSFIQKFYNLPKEGVYLFWALLVSFFISSLKTIPSIFLERKIQFQRIVLVQIIENSCFYITVIVLAFLKLGLFSFVVAVFFRAIIGLIVIYRISPWKPQLGISKKTLHELLSFGIPFQASSFLALFKDDLITLYLGKVIGFEGLGYIGWAKKWAEAHVRIVMDNITRVIFPLISRFQDDKQKISQLVEKVMYYQTAILAPTMLGAAIVINKLVYIIPHYNKWAVAIPFFYIFCLSTFFTSYSAPFVNLFNALGKVKISFGFMFFWTISMWLLTSILTHYYNLFGFPIAHLINSLTFIAVLYTAKRVIHFNFLQQIYPFIISAVIMGLCVLLVTQAIPLIPLFQVVLMVLLGMSVYYGLIRFVFVIDLLKEIKLFLKK